MWMEIDEWRPDISLYKTFFSWHISPDESARKIKSRDITRTHL